MPKYQIFISSTYEDLKDARRVVIEQLLNLGHIPVGMELFQAGNDSQWDYIKRRILECDYYLLIVGDRYGSCLPDGMSYTEREFHFALENGLPIASFLLSKDARQHLGRDKFEVDEQKIKRLEAFRNLVKERVVKYWSEIYEVAAQISSALPELIRQYPRPGLIQNPSFGDPLRAIRLPDGNLRGGTEISLYKILRERASEARAELFGFGLRKDADETYRKEVDFEELFPDLRPMVWQIDDLFRLIFSVREQLSDEYGMEVEDFLWATFAKDLLLREEMTPLRVVMNREGANWFKVRFRGSNWIEKLEKTGLMNYVPVAPGRDNLILTVAGRLLMGALARLPEMNIRE